MLGAVLAAMLLTLLLHDELTLGPGWVLPGIEGVLLIALVAGDPGRSRPHAGGPAVVDRARVCSW